MGVVAEGLRGKAFGVKDKAEQEAIKDEADGLAKRLFENVLVQTSIRVHITASEGIGRDLVAESFKAGDIINSEGKQLEFMLVDVIEGTNPFAYGNYGVPFDELEDSEAGGMSVAVTGPGVESLGYVPDIYADLFVTKVPPEFRHQFQEEDLDPYVETLKGIEERLRKVAAVNKISLNGLEVILMNRKREKKRITHLQNIKSRFPGLKITLIEDGTVGNGLLASLDTQTDKHKILWTVGAAPEGFMNLSMAGALKDHGALAGYRIYSKSVNHSPQGKHTAADLTFRYRFTDEEKKEIRKLRPDDAEDVIQGKMLFTMRDVKGNIDASLALITDSGVFQLPGVQNENGELFITNSIRVKSAGGVSYVWVEEETRSFSESASQLKVLKAAPRIETAI